MSLLGRPLAFERGDRVYLTTPLVLCTPTESQVDEFAFASAVKSSAPNEHIGWLEGKYVEGNRANLNNAMWLNEELAIKSLTPMLMPVTVMHDPRTAVGTIADCKLISGENARIDTILAVWRHRFPDVWEEAEANIKDGTMMQSMEAKTPWYSCSECGQQFIKLHEGKERASWCDHLRRNSSHRILGDVCFTGTGLIFGTRGGKGAYVEAHLDHFQDEIAEFHHKAEIDGTYKPEGSTPQMGFVQIDETELANLRKERDDNKRLADEKANENRELTTKAETAEANATKEKERADALDKDKKDLEEKSQRASLKDKRWGELGTGFTAKLGEVTQANLQESASTLSDEAWDARLKEVEELTGVKRAETASTEGSKEGGGDSKDASTDDTAGSSFTDEELAGFVNRGVTSPAQPAPVGGATVGRKLARSFKQSRQPAQASK